MNLEEKVKYLLDRQEIQDVIALYSQGQDLHQGDDGNIAEQWSKVFTEDAVLDYSTGGYHSDKATYREIIAWMRGDRGNNGVMNVFSNWQHHMGIPNVSIDGDTATARTEMWCTHRAKPGEDGRTWYLDDAVMFHDKLVRTPDGWRISYRYNGILWIDAFPTIKDPSGVWDSTTF